MVVPEFSGAITDGRGKYLEWAERFRDRVDLYDVGMAAMLQKVEGRLKPITELESKEMGISDRANKELQGFMKDRTCGPVGSTVRGNVSGLGIESWRLLSLQYNPRTLQSTQQSQQLELYPKGASKIAELPACLLKWKKTFANALKKVVNPRAMNRKGWHYFVCCQGFNAQRSQKWLMNFTLISHRC